MRNSIIGTLILVVASAAVEADVVHRRGGEPSLVGRIGAIDVAGVKITTDSGVEHLVSWDRVRTVEGDSTTSMAKYADLAVQAWRARSRLERGDAAMAESLFEKMFAQTKGQTNETALVIAEGLLRCRLARGDNADAVIPWLETARLRQAFPKSTVYSLLPAVIDESRLCPWLPPFWIRTQGLDALVKNLSAYKSDDQLINWFASAFQQAAAIHLNPSAAEKSISKAPDQAGAKMLEVILAAMTGGEPVRSALRKQLDSLPEWSQSWARVALSMSVPSSDPLAMRQQALVDLVHVPAKSRSPQPYLTALALWKLAQGCAALGDASAAAVFAGEFKSQFPQLAGTVGDPPMVSPPAATSRPIESTP